LPGALDACYWSIDHQKWKWKTADITVKFTKIEAGINLGLWGNEGGQEVRSSTLIKQVLEDGEQIKVDTEYKVDAIHYDMIVIAYPELNSIQTAFEFEFSVTGEEYPWYEKIFQFISTAEEPELVLYAFAVGYALLLIGLGAGVGCCICRCCH